jgi:hypothetical protein
MPPKNETNGKPLTGREFARVLLIVWLAAIVFGLAVCAVAPKRPSGRPSGVEQLPSPPFHWEAPPVEPVKPVWTPGDGLRHV